MLLNKIASFSLQHFAWNAQHSIKKNSFCAENVREPFSWIVCMLLAQQSFGNFQIFVRGTHHQCGVSRTCIGFIPNLHLLYPELSFELSQTSGYPKLRFVLSQTQVRAIPNHLLACNIKNITEKGSRRFFRHITDLFLAVRHKTGSKMRNRNIMPRAYLYG